jgi:hypothetical protein
MVTSGVVTADYPHGRGERMPAACVEIATDAEGGMSGGPVVNEHGDVIGIVSSSIDGGTMYATLLFDVLPLSVSCTAPAHSDRPDIDLITARSLGLVKIKGDVKRRAGGKVVVTMSDPEIQLMLSSGDPERVSKDLEFACGCYDAAWIEAFEERWGSVLESDAEDAAQRHLNRVSLAAAREFLAASDIPKQCLDAITKASASIMEGLDDPEIHWARADKGGKIELLYSFDLTTVAWEVEVSTADYRAHAAEFDKYFLNVEAEGKTTTLQEFQQLYLEAKVVFDIESDAVAHFNIELETTGVKRRRR